MTGGSPGGSTAWRAFAAAMTSITVNGGGSAPLPVFRAIGSVLPNDAGGENFHAVTLLDPVHRHDARFGDPGAFPQPSDLGLRQVRGDDAVALPRMIADAQLAERGVADDPARANGGRGGTL